MKLNALPTLSKSLQCFKCQGWDQRESEYATKRNMILREGRLYYLGEEFKLENEGNDDNSQDRERIEPETQEGSEEEVLPCEGECDVPYYVVQRNLFSKVWDNQRENLFLSKCLIKDSASSMIIDSGNGVNIVCVTLLIT